jgi:hypothetical protein
MCLSASALRIAQRSMSTQATSTQKMRSSTERCPSGDRALACARRRSARRNPRTSKRNDSRTELAHFTVSLENRSNALPGRSPAATSARYEPILRSGHVVTVVMVPGSTGATKPSPSPPGPAKFKAGAAVAGITPPPHGSVVRDPSNCRGQRRLTGCAGSRRGALSRDQQTKHFAFGDAYVDCNGNGRWDGVVLGGGACPRRRCRTSQVVDRTRDDVGA